MAHAFITAKSLIVSYNPYAPTDSKGEVFRGTAHEFQDYAYRLASDLNDLKHLSIYMRLAKTTPRFMLEETYSSIADIAEESKGRLFMWKLKQIREEIKNRLWKNNFDYSFVIAKTSKLRDRLIESVISKTEADSLKMMQILDSLEILNTLDNKRVLLLGSFPRAVLEEFKNKSKKVIGLDLGKKITSVTLKASKIDCSSKDFLSKNFQDHYFDYVLANKYFDNVPSESEMDFLTKLSRVLKLEGKFIFIMGNIYSESSQQWKEMSLGNEITYFFEKKSVIKDIESKLLNCRLKLAKFNKYDRRYVLLGESTQVLN